MADVYNIKFCYTVLKKINCHIDDCSVYLDCDKHIKPAQYSVDKQKMKRSEKKVRFELFQIGHL